MLNTFATEEQMVNISFSNYQLELTENHLGIGPPITDEEVSKLAEQMKDGKAPTPGDLHAEFLKIVQKIQKIIQ